MNAAEHISTVRFEQKEIYVIDYSDLKDIDLMIEITRLHKKIILEEQREHLFLANYSNCHYNRRYVDEAKKFSSETKSFVRKGAFLGIDPSKGIILNAVARLFKANYKAFKKEAEAMEYLVN